MPKKIILFPFGGNSREALLSILAVNTQKKVWDVIGFIDADPATHGKDCLGVKVLGGNEILKKFPDALVLALPGNPANFLKRKEIIKDLGIGEDRFAAIIDPSVNVSPDAKIGRNTLVMPNCVISCAVTIGSHCIILPNTVVSHDSNIGDYCCVGSNCSISGNVVIGTGCYVGSGARIKEGISVKKNVLIGLGAVVISDVEEGIVSAGNPAHFIRKA